MALPLAGAIDRASDWSDQFQTGTDAYANYTPTWTSSGTAPVIGNGSITGAYMKIGRQVHVQGTLTIGSTTTVGTGTYNISVPFAFGVVGFSPMWGIWFRDSSANADYSGFVQVAANTLQFNARILTATPSPNVQWSATAPVAPATGDFFAWNFVYSATS